MQKWKKQKNDWLISFRIDPKLALKNPDKYNKLYDAIPAIARDQFELVQQRRIHIELDKCHGCCLLKTYHEHVVKAIEFFHRKRGWVGDYVVMPNHVHVLLQPFPGVILEEWLYTIKRYSSTQILSEKSKGDSLTKDGHLWQIESHDRIVRNRYELARIRKYIENNPVKLFLGTFALKQMDWLDEFHI